MAAHLLIGVELRDVPFLPFYLAVFASAVLGGLLPGLAATGMSWVITNRFFMPDGLQQATARGNAFIVTGVVLSLLMEHLRRARFKELRARLAAENAVRVRDDFLAMASHELKTPLTSLKLQLQLLLRAAQRTKETSLPRDHLVAKLTTCDRQIEKLTALIDQFLDVSQINRDHLVLIREPCDLSALVREVVERCGREIETSGAVLSLHLDPDVIALVDRQRIDQVLSNLLSNAVKYGGGSPIDVRLQRTDDAAMITVSDRGLGIAPEAQERIFQKFERGSQRESVSGLGLGLFMSREIIAAHRGQISVESEMGKGATFKIELALLR